MGVDAKLSHLQITPRFPFGPDVFDPANNVMVRRHNPSSMAEACAKIHSRIWARSPLICYALFPIIKKAELAS